MSFIIADKIKPMSLVHFDASYVNPLNGETFCVTCCAIQLVDVVCIRDLLFINNCTAFGAAFGSVLSITSMKKGTFFCLLGQ